MVLTLFILIILLIIIVPWYTSRRRREPRPYEVEIIQNGPGGQLLYAEGGRVLAFNWEFCAEGAAISVPPPQEWDRCCEKDKSGWAIGRRMEILERIAQEMRRRKAKTAVISYENEWVILSFEDHWIFTPLKKFLGR